jgi:uncharacterized protein (TIGR02391 family)
VVRQVETNGELTVIHAAGAGLVFNDFTFGPTGATDNVLHTADCTWVSRMLLHADPAVPPSVRKFAFDTLAEAEAWLSLQRGPAGRSWKYCSRCRPDLLDGDPGQASVGLGVHDRRRVTPPQETRMHPLIAAEARPQFLIGKHQHGVFASMRAVEVRVRQLAGLGNEAIGVDLMNRAFGPNGRLTDSLAPKGEQEGTRMLFAGAYAVLRNPAGHRQVDYHDVSEAAEAVLTASLLMRILDRVEARLRGRRSPPWTPDEVVQVTAPMGQDVPAVAAAVRDWAAAHPHISVAGGTGLIDRSFTMSADTGRSISPLRAVLYLYATDAGAAAMLEIRIKQMRETPPYDSDEPRARLLADLRGLGIPRLAAAGALNMKQPNIPLSELTNNRVDALLAVVNRWIECVRAHSGEPEALGNAQTQTASP